MQIQVSRLQVQQLIKIYINTDCCLPLLHLAFVQGYALGLNHQEIHSTEASVPFPTFECFVHI
jgi:hypothetical protein